MLEMIDNMAEKTKEQQNWFQSVRENITTWQRKKEIRDQEKKTLEEENERFRSFLNQSR